MKWSLSIPMHCAAIKDVFQDTRRSWSRQARSPSRAQRNMPNAKISRGDMVAVCSGANMNFDRLRFVAERAEIGEKREAMLAVTIPETPGSFSKFCALIGNRDITEFNYRYSDPRAAKVFVGIQVQGPDGDHRIGRQAATQHLPTLDLPTTKWPSCISAIWSAATRPEVKDEILFRFEFPEQPGALMNFLNSMRPQLEHHPVPLPQPRRRLRTRAGRHAGTERGRKKISAPSSMPWGIATRDESDNPAYRLFLG